MGLGKILRRSKSFRGVGERHGENIQRAYLRSHVKLGEVRWGEGTGRDLRGPSDGNGCDGLETPWSSRVQ